MLRYLITCLLLSYLAGGHSESLESAVWHSSDYLHQHPRQRLLMEQFLGTVKAPATPLPNSPLTPVRIAVVLPEATGKAQGRVLLTAFKARMKALHINYRLDTYEYPAQATDQSLFDQYAAALVSSPDYLITTLGGFQQRQLIASILAGHSTKVILYDVTVPVKAWENHPPLLYVGVDYRLGISQLARYLDRELAASAVVAAIMLPAGYESQLRCDEFINAMSALGRTVRGIYYHDGSLTTRQNVKAALESQTPPDFLFNCANRVAVYGDSQGAMALVPSNRWEDAVALSKRPLQAHEVALVTLFDDIEIAMAETIRNDIEQHVTPNLFVADIWLMSWEQGASLDAQDGRHLPKAEVWQNN